MAGGARESRGAAAAVSKNATTPRWLLLAHQLPTRPSNARVKTWRRLQQIGAVPTRNSVYALPNTDGCREDFEWIRSEIVALGGEATLFAADALDEGNGADIVAASRRAREADYKALARELHRVRKDSRSAGKPGSRHDRTGRALRHVRERYDEITRIDFFNATGRDAIAGAIDALDARLAARPAAPEEEEETVTITPNRFSNRRWVTRPRPGVDRMASAWLIRRFIDRKARFGFAAQPADSDVPFDMYAGEFSHQGALCTFEVLVRRFKIADAAVRHLGHIVHDLDMKETLYGAAETPAVGRMVDGLRQMHADDSTLLEQGIAMFEALARSLDTNAPKTKKMKRKRPAP